MCKHTISGSNSSFLSDNKPKLTTQLCYTTDGLFKTQSFFFISRISLFREIVLELKITALIVQITLHAHKFRIVL